MSGGRYEGVMYSLSAKVNSPELLERQLSSRGRGEHGIIAPSSSTEPYTTAEGGNDVDEEAA